MLIYFVGFSILVQCSKKIVLSIRKPLHIMSNFLDLDFLFRACQLQAFKILYQCQKKHLQLIDFVGRVSIVKYIILFTVFQLAKNYIRAKYLSIQHRFGFIWGQCHTKIYYREYSVFISLDTQSRLENKWCSRTNI